MQARHEQKGFTLIELIVVIVILGILAATALPRFIDLQGEAGNGAADGVAGAMSSASSMNYAQRLASNNARGTALSPAASNICTDVTFWSALVTGTTFINTGTPTGNNQFLLGGGAASNCAAPVVAGTAITTCTVMSGANGAAARPVPSVICP